MAKQGTNVRTLREGTEMYKELATRVENLWLDHKDDIQSWPEPVALYDEFENQMLNYGATHSKRLDKFRNLYNRLCKKAFERHGK